SLPGFLRFEPLPVDPLLGLSSPSIGAPSRPTSRPMPRLGRRAPSPFCPSHRPCGRGHPYRRGSIRFSWPRVTPLEETEHSRPVRAILHAAESRSEHLLSTGPPDPTIPSRGRFESGTALLQNEPMRARATRAVDRIWSKPRASLRGFSDWCFPTSAETGSAV